MINNKNFRENFKNKNYEVCNNILENEIINNLTNHIKSFNPEYQFSSLSDLKNNSYKFLNNKEKICSTLLYNYSKENQSNPIKLYNLLNIYSSIYKKHC